MLDGAASRDVHGHLADDLGAFVEQNGGLRALRLHRAAYAGEQAGELFDGDVHLDPLLPGGTILPAASMISMSGRPAMATAFAFAICIHSGER